MCFYLLSHSAHYALRIQSESTSAVPALVRAAGRRRSPCASRAMSYLYHQMPHAPPAGSWSKQDKGGSPASRLSVAPPRENGRVSASPPAGSPLLRPLRRFSHQTDRTTLRPRDPTRGSGAMGGGTVGDRSRVASRESPTLPSVSSARTVLRGRRDPRLPPLPIGPICPQSFW